MAGLNAAWPPRLGREGTVFTVDRVSLGQITHLVDDDRGQLAREPEESPYSTFAPATGGRREISLITANRFGGKHMVELKFSASVEEMGVAIASALRAAAHAHYYAAMVGWNLRHGATVRDTGDEPPPKDVRAGLLKEAFDSVVDDLPEGNPYRIPLQNMRDQAIAKVTA
jgi:hypothetical protein